LFILFQKFQVLKSTTEIKRLPFHGNEYAAFSNQIHFYISIYLLSWVPGKTK